MSGSSALIQHCFTFDLFQWGANREQTAVRPRIAVCLQQYARNFSSIYSARPIKAALPRMLSGKHFFHVHCEFNGVSALTLTQQLLITYTQIYIYTANPHPDRKPAFFQNQEGSRFDQHVYKRRPGWVRFFQHEQGSVIDQWTHKHSYTYFLLNLFWLSSSLREGHWTSPEVTATTWRWEIFHALCREAAGDRLGRTNWNHYSPVSLVPVKLWVCRNVVSYCIQACAPSNRPEPV